MRLGHVAEAKRRNLTCRVGKVAVKNTCYDNAFWCDQNNLCTFATNGATGERKWSQTRQEHVFLAKFRGLNCGVTEPVPFVIGRALQKIDNDLLSFYAKPNHKIPALLDESQIQDNFWLQIDAKPNKTKAEESARYYESFLPDVAGFRLESGWYAIALGPYSKVAAQNLLKVRRDSDQVIYDSFISNAEDYTRQFWPLIATQITE